MAHLLFAAHDPGAADVLLPVMTLARERGHRVSPLAAGPAVDSWSRDGEAAPEAGPDRDAWRAEVERLAPDLVVTCTGFAEFEPALWELARGAGIRSVAAVDAWTSIELRFKRGQPDAVCVIDEGMRRRILDGGWCRARLHVTGQPHLEAVVPGLAERRRTRTPAAVPAVAFFSESLIQDYPGDLPGYDQYTVCEALLGALDGLGPLSLTVKHHPRERRKEWANWLAARKMPPGIDVALGGEDAHSLLVDCDGVLGMTSMVLVKAALAGAPVLSLQPGRTRNANPGLDALEGLRVVADGAGIPSEVARFVGSLGRPAEVSPGLSPVLADAGGRFLAALESELREPAPMVGILT